MKRGAVIIGVNKYNDSTFPDLQAAVRGAKDVAKWAELNGFEVKCITDEEAPVKFEHVQEAIEYFTSRTGDQRLEQLLVYFSGHGLNSGFNETWLLSKATRNGNEAVNLASTIDMARYATGIPHVVFISDACRSPADTIDTQNITGSVAIVGQQKDQSATVDRFYATRPGNSAMEVKDPLGHENFEAIYTKCILDGLEGAEPSIIEQLRLGQDTLAVITSDSLKRYLAEVMPKRVAALRLRRAQDPDAIIESRLPLCLSRVLLPSQKLKTRRPLSAPDFGGHIGDDAEEKLKTREPLSAPDLGKLLDHTASSWVWRRDAERPLIWEYRWSQRAGHGAYSKQILDAMNEDASAQDVDILVVGANVRAADSIAGVCKVSSAGDHTRIKAEGLEQYRPLPVLVEFSDGRGALVGVFYGYRSTLLIDRGELASVTYEIPRQSSRWEENKRLRALRASVAAAARHGAFRIEDDEAREFGNRIRMLKGLDPTLGIYAAYAYHQIGLLEKIRSVADFMLSDLGGYLPFDVTMLLRTPNSIPQELEKVIPYCPMLTQGWALLPAKRVHLPPLMEAAGRHLAPSLWTLFKPEGVRLIRRYMSSGEF